MPIVQSGSKIYIVQCIWNTIQYKEYKEILDKYMQWKTSSG